MSPRTWSLGHEAEMGPRLFGPVSRLVTLGIRHKSFMTSTCSSSTPSVGYPSLIVDPQLAAAITQDDLYPNAAAFPVNRRHRLFAAGAEG